LKFRATRAELRTLTHSKILIAVYALKFRATRAELRTLTHSKILIAV